MMADDRAVQFSILLPVHRPPALLPFAVKSVLAQTLTSFELLIVCDGAPAETVEVARSFETSDSRVVVLERPKGERHGEAHRHEALSGAHGELVAHIGDDDLWLPNHLEEMAKLLHRVDFGNLCMTVVGMGKDRGRIRPVDLRSGAVRRRMCSERWNGFGPIAVGYRMEVYRALESGWTPSPPSVWPDLFMWRKFLKTKGLRFGSRMAVTSLKFAAEARLEMSQEERALEISAWADRVADPGQCDLVVQEALLDLAHRYLMLDFDKSHIAEGPAQTLE